MKKYAITCPSPFGTLWYYEEDIPENWWTSTKSKAMLFNSIKGAEAKALFIVGKHPEMIGKVALFEGDEAEFGRKSPSREDLAKGPTGDVLGAIFDTLFGGSKRAERTGLRRDEEAPPPDRPGESEGGSPSKP